MLFWGQPQRSGTQTGTFISSAFSITAAGVWELALKVSQVQGGVREPGAAAAFEKPLASRRARSDALSERDELRPARVNLPRRDTAWHLSAFDTATCDEGEVIGRPAGWGGEGGGARRGLTRSRRCFICCLPPLSSACASNAAQSVAAESPATAPPGRSWLQASRRVRVHVLVCVWCVCV